MSEQPTLPTNDPKSDQINRRAQERMNSGETETDFNAWKSEFSSNMNRWKTEVSDVPRFKDETWNLHEEESGEPAGWMQGENETLSDTTEVPEYVMPEKTEEQKTEEALFYLDDDALRKYMLENTRGVIAYRRGHASVRSDFELAA